MIIHHQNTNSGGEIHTKMTNYAKAYTNGAATMGPENQIEQNH